MFAHDEPTIRHIAAGIEKNQNVLIFVPKNQKVLIIVLFSRGRRRQYDRKSKQQTSHTEKRPAVNPKIGYFYLPGGIDRFCMSTKCVPGMEKRLRTVL